MLHAPFKVVLDACVLFPLSLRDTLLRAAARHLYQMYWSQQILDEVCEALQRGKKAVSAPQAQSLRRAMESHFPESMVTDHEPLIDAMRNEPDDRHVAAAALKSGAQVIVTSNLKDFENLPSGIEAQSPDEFLSNLFGLDPELMVELLREQARALKNPPFSFEDLVKALAKIVPRFAARVLAHTLVGPT